MTRDLTEDEIEAARQFVERSDPDELAARLTADLADGGSTPMREMSDSELSWELQQMSAMWGLLGRYLGHERVAAETSGQGWDLFNVGEPLLMGIERLDDAAVFEDDESALLHAFKESFKPEGDVAKAAVTLHGLANELRARTWGREHANRRTPPGAMVH
jgi:hypothetical protein